ncbi:hypothetical protein GCM10027278_23600 [Paralcaligenes ginsengisoli]
MQANRRQREGEADMGGDIGCRTASADKDLLEFIGAIIPQFVVPQNKSR